MKTTTKLFYILSISLLFAGCNTNKDDYEAGGDIDITEKLPEGKFGTEVTNLTATRLVQGIVLKWNEPDSRDLNAYLVEWKGSIADKALYSEVVPTGTSEIQLNKLFNEDYTLSVKCVSVGLLYSEGTSLTSRPIEDNTPPQNVSNLKLESLAVSADLSWDNTDESYEKIVIEVFNLTEDKTESTIEVSSLRSSYSVRGLAEATEYKMNIHTENYLANKSSILERTFRTGNAAKILDGQGKENPTDVQANVLKGTCTSPGQDSDVFENTYDGDLGTMYHSQWSMGGASHPDHHPSFEYTFAKPTDIDYILYYERKAGTNGRIQAMTMSIMTEASNPKYIEVGSFSNIPNNGDVKRIVFPITTGILKIKFDVTKSANNDVAIQEVEFYKIGM